VGTGGGDTIAFSAAGSAVQVNFNGASVCTITGAQRLLVYGLGGGDDVSVSDGLALPAWLFGGAGDDLLKGGTGNDVLDGGSGNNDLRGGLGNDQIAAGDGNNTVHTDGGNDLIVLGTGSNDVHAGSGNN